MNKKINNGEKVSFSKEHAKSFVKNILDKCPKVSEKFYQNIHKYNDEFPVSILRIPHLHESDITNNDYDTTITLSLNDEKVIGKWKYIYSTESIEKFKAESVIVFGETQISDSLRTFKLTHNRFVAAENSAVIAERKRRINKQIGADLFVFAL